MSLLAALGGASAALFGLSAWSTHESPLSRQVGFGMVYGLVLFGTFWATNDLKSGLTWGLGFTIPFLFGVFEGRSLRANLRAQAPAPRV